MRPFMQNPTWRQATARAAAFATVSNGSDARERTEPKTEALTRGWSGVNSRVGATFLLRPLQAGV